MSTAVAGVYENNPYRIISYDMEKLGTRGIPYLINYAIEEFGATPRQWVWHYEYDNDNDFCLIKKMTPSAMDEYERAVGGTTPTQANYAAKVDGGLVYAYANTEDNRRSEVRVGEGDLGDVGNFTLVTRTNFPSSPGTNERLWLPNSIERFRMAGSTADGDVETTTFAYRFHASTDGIAAITSAVEAELESENGPSGSGNTYTSHELFNARGLNTWSHSSDNALTFRRFDALTGEVVLITRNADPDAPGGEVEDELDGADYGGISTTGWGTPEDGGELTTSYTLDLKGVSGRARRRAA